MLSPQERRLRILLRILAFAFSLAILAYLLPALGVFGSKLKDAYAHLPFVTNSVVKIGVLAALALFASSDVRQWRLLTKLVIVGHLISELAMAAVLIWGDTTRVMPMPDLMGGDQPVRNFIVFAMVLDGVILVLLTWFYRSAEKARYELRYFSPTQFRALAALADVVVAGETETLTPEEVARNTDSYLASFNARSRWLAKAVLTGIQYYPLLTFRAPFSYLSAEDRLDFLEKRFYQAVTLRLTPPFVRELLQAAIRMAKQLSFLGYYGDDRTHAEIGYKPYSQRGRPRVRNYPTTLNVLTPGQINTEVMNGDVVIIGSGAAGAILAHDLIERGHQVVVLERGKHVDPSTFSENEIQMLSSLYSDGAFQLTRDFRFQVLQGSCVGGTTVINNAVSFDIPPHVLDYWNSELTARINVTHLNAAFQDVRAMLKIHEQTDALRLNPGAQVFTDGVKRLGYDQQPYDYRVVSANIDECLGCGYCNIGCAYGRKLSMLDVVLPHAQEVGSGALRIISECDALRLKGRGPRITSVECRLSDGRKIEVRGKTFIIAAGAISSSLLLQRSGIGGPNVGKRVSFNMGSPVHAVFPTKIDAYDGLQISHYLATAPGRGFILETWYNPPVAQALVMPGWFKDHFVNMHRYDRMTAVGVLVGTEPNAVVKPAGLTGREISYTPTPDDLRKVLDGISLAGEIFLAGGAHPVIPATFTYNEYHDTQQLSHIYDHVRDASDITLGTGHPMGGNAMSDDPRIGVVDSQFSVNGCSNLFVCDASIFPSSLGVNPQLTVMALARYAVPIISNAIPNEAAAGAPAMAGGAH